MPDEIVNQIVEDLRKVEGELEAVGQKACPLPGGALTWNAINRALEEVQEAIRVTYFLRG